MSALDRVITAYMLWREHDADECDRVIDGVRTMRLDVPTRALIVTDTFIFPIPRPVTIELAHELLSAGALDTVTLSDGRHVMLIDDNGIAKDLPVNELATLYYWHKCGRVVPRYIHGDALIVPDADYITDEALRKLYD